MKTILPILKSFSLLALLVMAVLLSCCQSGSKRLPMLPIPKTVEVAPKVSAIRPALDQASDRSAALRAGNASLARQTDDAGKQARDISAEAARLAKAGVATAAELVKQAADNAVLAAKVGQLQDQVKAQGELLEKQSSDLSEARTAQAEAQAAASAGDAAQSNLVEQVKSLQKQAKDANDEKDAEKARNVELTTQLKAEKETSSKRFWWIVGLVSLIVGWIAIKVLIFMGKLSWKLPI